MGQWLQPMFRAILALRSRTRIDKHNVTRARNGNVRTNGAKRFGVGECLRAAINIAPPQSTLRTGLRIARWRDDEQLHPCVTT